MNMLFELFRCNSALVYESKLSGAICESLERIREESHVWGSGCPRGIADVDNLV